jgi:hypothetical protein
MSLFSAKQPVTKQINGTMAQPNQNQHDLNYDEIDLILRLLATTNFPVKDIEVLYHTLVKLHQQREVKKQQN